MTFYNYLTNAQKKECADSVVCLSMQPITILQLIPMTSIFLPCASNSSAEATSAKVTESFFVDRSEHSRP